jgi:hypothetical protein
MWARTIVATAAVLGFAAVAAEPASAASVRTGHRVHTIRFSHPAYGYGWGYQGNAYAAYGSNYRCPALVTRQPRPPVLELASGAVRAGGEPSGLDPLFLTCWHGKCRYS